MRKYTSRDIGRVKTEEDRWFYAAGIPQQFWADDYELAPYPLLCTQADGSFKNLSSEGQLKHYNWLMDVERLRTSSLLAVVGSSPTDAKAMVIACRFAKVAVLQWLGGVHVFDVASYDAPTSKDQVVVMYNLSATAYTNERIMKVKDRVHAYQDRVCILVVAGNPHEYATKVLNIQPNVLFYFEGNLMKQRAL